jgi:dolichol-phosphate mannosyltransferase
VKYSVVVPVYNDAYLADAFCEEVAKTFEGYLGKDVVLENEVEVVFVDDGSPRADTLSTLRDVADKWPFVRVVALSRNFGQHVSTTAGINHARGQYVATMNVDAEDPPDQLPILYAEMEAKGLDFVRGRYKERHVSLGQKITSVSFNWVLNKLTGSYTPLDAATLRVMSRRFVDAYNALQERSRYIPGLETWLGFKQGYVTIRHQPRKQGKSSYNFIRRWRVAADSIVSFSDLPLRMGVYLGLAVAFGGLLLLAYVVSQKLLYGDTLVGFTSIMSVIVLLGGAQIIVIGLASIYIGRILREVQGRPVYVVREEYPAAEANVTSLVRQVKDEKKEAAV